MIDAQKLQRKVPKIFFPFEFFNNAINFNQRFDQIRIKICSYSFVLIGNFVIRTNKFPLSIWLNINTETTILQIWLEIVNGCLYETSSRVEMFQVFLLIGIALFLERNYSLLSILDQRCLQNWVYLLPHPLLLRFWLLTELCQNFSKYFVNIDVCNTSRLSFIINF